MVNFHISIISFIMKQLAYPPQIVTAYPTIFLFRFIYMDIWYV